MHKERRIMQRMQMQTPEDGCSSTRAASTSTGAGESEGGRHAPARLGGKRLRTPSSSTRGMIDMPIPGPHVHVPGRVYEPLSRAYCTERRLSSHLVGRPQKQCLGPVTRLSASS